METKYKGIIFDLDGTLLDTLHSLALSMNTVLKKLNFPEHPEDRYRILVGEGMKKLVKQALPPDEANNEEIIAIALTELKNVYNEKWQEATKLYPGIRELLNELGKKPCKKAILSNKPHEYTLKVADHFLNNWNFDTIFGLRDEVPRKPDPTSALEIAAMWHLAPEELIFVGDTGIDLQTANAAGMYSIGVTWGFRPDELAEENPGIIISSPLEILSLL